MATTAPAATRLQVLYATKGDKHIELLGGRNPDGSLWTMTQEEAIRQMEARTLELFVHTRTDDVEVDVVEYLRSHRNGTPADNLLHLPEVPTW